MNCFLQDGTVEDFVKATLDPVPSISTLKVSPTTNTLMPGRQLFFLPLPQWAIHSGVVSRVPQARGVPDAQIG